MPVYRLADQILELPRTTYADQGIRERGDLQRLLKSKIDVVARDVLIISEEFGEWEDSRRRIDLLGIDQDAKLVVIELKRDDEGGHMELQAIRYAAMVSRMTFQRAVRTYQTFLDRSGATADAREKILSWLRTSEPPADDTVLDVRIVLVAADFAKELTTAVLWLREWDLDIRCVRATPYQDDHGIVLEVQQIVPLPEAAEYQVTIREEAASRREAREGGAPTGYYFMNTGDQADNPSRSWEDCRTYNFLGAGGGPQWQECAKALKVGDKVFAYLSRHGYVGLAEVVATAVPMNEFIPPGQTRRFVELDHRSQLRPEILNDPAMCDWCVGVNWLHDIDRDHAVLMNRARRQTFQSINQQDLVDDLLTALRQTEAGSAGN